MNKQLLIATIEKRKVFCDQMFQNTESVSAKIAYAAKSACYQKIIDEIKKTFLFVFKKQIKSKYFWIVKTAALETDAAVIIFKKEVEVYNEVLELLF